MHKNMLENEFLLQKLRFYTERSPKPADQLISCDLNFPGINERKSSKSYALRFVELREFNPVLQLLNEKVRAGH